MHKRAATKTIRPSIQASAPRRTVMQRGRGGGHTGSVGVVFLVVPDECRVLVGSGHQLLQELRR